MKVQKSLEGSEVGGKGPQAEMWRKEGHKRKANHEERGVSSVDLHMEMHAAIRVSNTKTLTARTQVPQYTEAQ